ncbi:MAG: hypothetical protein LBF51_04735, partial [Zoogloeaceae bacterium]|jgi:hypothetical protein|nr:hypothetical protein [Zoogloeaceae bacterium]
VSTTDFVIANFNVIDDFSTSATAVLGYYWSAQYTPDNDRLWFARGNAIRVYNASSTATPVSTLAMSALNGGGSYNSLNDLTYVGATGTIKLSGYRSPLQRANTPFAQAARALTKGRPELTEEEFQQLVAIHGQPETR